MRQTSETLGIGIIGCGNISTTYLTFAPLFQGIEVRACADMSQEAAQTRAAEYGIRSSSVQDLLASDDIDIILNLTIPDAHFAVTKSILEAGKHAYSEKPLVLTLEQGQELKALADANGLKVGCAPDTFLGGSHQLARKTVDDGKLGTITSGTAHIMGHGMEHWHPNPDFFFKKGGGPILDMGPYYVTNLINLIGPVKRVAALSSIPSPTRTITSQPRHGETLTVETPTTIHALLEFASGAVVTLSASWDVWSHRHGYTELYGTDGSLYLPDPNFFGGTLEASGTDKTIAAVEGWSHPFNPDNYETPEGMVANYRTAGLADFALSIIEKGDARCSLERALHVVDVLTSILRSGEEGRFIDLTTTCTRPAALGIEEATALLRTGS